MKYIQSKINSIFNFLRARITHDVSLLTIGPNEARILYDFLAAFGGKFQYQNSMSTSRHLLILPGGPDQPFENVERVIEVIKQIDNEFTPWQHFNFAIEGAK